MAWHNVLPIVDRFSPSLAPNCVHVCAPPDATGKHACHAANAPVLESSVPDKKSDNYYVDVPEGEPQWVQDMVSRFLRVLNQEIRRTSMWSGLRPPRCGSCGCQIAGPLVARFRGNWTRGQ